MIWFSFLFGGYSTGDAGLMQKKGKLLISHRFNRLPLLHSCPGGFSRSWSYKTCHPKFTIKIQKLQDQSLPGSIGFLVDPDIIDHHIGGESGSIYPLLATPGTSYRDIEQ